MLVVPATERFDESAAAFVVGEHGTTCLVQLRRAAADLRVVLASDNPNPNPDPNPNPNPNPNLTPNPNPNQVLASESAGNARHWASTLPLPGGIPFRLVHKQLGMVVAAGTTDGESCCELAAAAGAVLVGEVRVRDRARVKG